MRGNWFLMGLKFALGIILYFMVLAWAIMLLWNVLVPEIAGWQALTYTQALILLAMVRLLVGFRCFSGRHWKHKFGHNWSGLSDEERAEMRKKFKSRWCNHT